MALAAAAAVAPVDVNPVKKFTNPVRLTHRDPCLTAAGIDAANQINVWHKFIIYNVAPEDKGTVLDNLIRACAPVFFIPVLYKMESHDKATFLTFCRSTSIQKLVNQKLQMKLVSGRVVNYDIILAFLAFKDMQVNPQKIITNAIKIRFSRETAIKKIFNLENFTNDPMLGSVYCPIHIPTVFDTILAFARGILGPNQNRDIKIPIRELIMRNNRMDSLAFHEKVFGFHLTKLDVRNNLLADMSQLRPFSEYKITELWLDGNPLCKNYTKIKDYIEAAKNIFPTLQQLDNHVLGMEHKLLPIHHSHYIQNKEKLSLVKQFVKHFFTCYDQDDRAVLNGLYDAGALFSMTIGPVSENSHKLIIKSFATNRNLLKFVDYGKCAEFLFYGPEKIISALRREPATLHVLKLLSIDLLFSTSNSFAISVSGPFLYRKSQAAPMFFSRTLIVVSKEDNEFCIINDQYHLEACPQHFQSMLPDPKQISDQVVPEFDPVSFSTAEKYQLLRLLQELTTMNAEYSDKFLKESNWDIRHAIKNFMQTYVNNKIPAEAFRW